MLLPGNNLSFNPTPILVDTTGDGYGDSYGYDTTGDGKVDTIPLQQVNVSKQVQYDECGNANAIL